jgi:hypothetical protein
MPSVADRLPGPVRRLGTPGVLMVCGLAALIGVRQLPPDASLREVRQAEVLLVCAPCARHRSGGAVLTLRSVAAWLAGDTARVQTVDALPAEQRAIATWKGRTTLNRAVRQAVPSPGSAAAN